MKTGQTDTDATVVTGCDGSWDDIPPVRDAVQELPDEGVYNGDIAHVYYVGVQPSKFKAEGRRTIFVCFEFEVGGKRRRSWRRYTHSLSQMGDFYALVVAALGKSFPRNSDGSFDAKLLVGRPVMVEVVHTEKGGRTYADVGAVTRHPQGLPVLSTSGAVEVPQWIVDLRSKRLDKPPAPPASTVSPTATAPTAPAPTATAAAAPEGDAIEQWAQVGYCQAGKEEDVGVGCDA